MVYTLFMNNKFYKQKYPDWSEEHIIKMLDDCILSTDI